MESTNQHDSKSKLSIYNVSPHSIIAAEAARYSGGGKADIIGLGNATVLCFVVLFFFSLCVAVLPSFP